MDVDTMTTLGGIAAALLGTGGAGGYLTARQKARAKEREAEAAVERSKIIAAEHVGVATIQADVTMSRSLLERLDKVEAETKQCHEERRADNDRRERERERDKAQRRADREACDRKIAALQRRIFEAEADLGTVAGRTAETRAAVLRLSRSPSSNPPPPDDWLADTGLHELERIRTRTPTGPILPVPPKRASRRPPPEKKTGDETT